MAAPHKHEGLRDTLREEIKSGKYPPGTALPDELRWEYRAQPQTWARALSELMGEGMLESRFGVNGPVVLSKPGRLIPLELTPEKMATLEKALSLLNSSANREVTKEHFDQVERGRLRNLWLHVRKGDNGC